MTSFIYQPERMGQEEDFKVLSSLNGDNNFEVGSAAKSLKRTLILRESSSKMRRKSRQTNRDMGLTYSSKALAWDFQDHQNGGRKDRSLKIDCSGPADIVSDLQDLDYEYIPKRKSQSLASQPRNELQLPLEEKEAERDGRGEMRESYEPEESWDQQAQREKLTHNIWFFIFMLIVVSLKSQVRSILADVYATLRSL